MSEKYAKALDKLIDARDEIVRLLDDLERANERLDDALALLGEWQALPVKDYWRNDLAVRTSRFMDDSARDCL